MKFAVVRNIIRWLHCVDNPHVIVIIPVPGQVQRPDARKVRLAILNDFTTLAHQSVNGTHDIFFVTWNRV